MATIEIGSYRVQILENSVSADYKRLGQSAQHFDEYDIASRNRSSICAVCISHRTEPPRLVVAQHHPLSDAGFPLGVMVIPETSVVLIGAGERLLAYELDGPSKLWEDHAEVGFWSFERHGEVILMAAELELAAWSLQGHKLWTTFVEPPWSYKVYKDQVVVDVMGNDRQVRLLSGSLL